MVDVPDKPAGSIIQEREDPDARMYFWRAPTAGIQYTLIKCFGIAFLSAWAIALATMVIVLLWNPAVRSDADFLIGLAGLTIGGGLTMVLLYFMLRAPRAESVTLGRDRFRHDPGGRALRLFDLTCLPAPSFAHITWGEALRRPRPIELDEGDVDAVVLERVGERQRLRFDHGADRVEIGRCLREPEREWLAAVIQAWHGE